MSLSTDEIDLIQSTFNKVAAEVGVEKVGILLFKHIFEAAPQAAALFSFGKVPNFDPKADHSKNAAVVKHATKVVQVVATAVGKLKDLPALVPVLEKLGKNHAKYGVVEAHYPIVGGAFLKTLSVGLGNEYTKGVETAYTKMWSIVAATMQAGAAK